MAYLTPDEYAKYCGGVTVSDIIVEQASALMDSIMGKSLYVKTVTDLVRLKKQNGRLTSTPIVAIDTVKGVSISPYGINESDLDTTSVYLLDDRGHFMFNVNSGLSTVIWGCPDQLKITYRTGYVTIPEEIKVVCGIIARNIVNLAGIGGIAGAKTIASLDFNVTLFDDRVFTTNELTILQKYKVV